MEISDFTLTKHAIARALDMGITGDMIRECLTNPDKVEACKMYPDYTLYSGGNITCSVASDMALVTILWRSKELWANDLAERPAYDGRKYRG